MFKHVYLLLNLDWKEGRDDNRNVLPSKKYNIHIKSE